MYIISTFCVILSFEFDFLGKMAKNEIKNLVIVESPAKARTIEKFLGKDYKVMSSYGHIRDLRKKNFSVDVDHDFTPIYEIPDDKRQLVKDLKDAAARAQTVWLASDEDREGEAIAWHLSEVLNLDPARTRRIVFHEITKNAIINAIENPRDIDINRVDAQQARRVLDRIVGFELSPVLWKKIKPALSAGRVQSVAVRLIVERENEIRNFVPEQYSRVNATFATSDGVQMRSELSRRLTGEAEAREFLSDCASATYKVSDIVVKPLRKSPAPPFTTSTLQQEAARKLGFSVSRTMMVAQKLYEAGHITYMRTDSLNLSQLAVGTIAEEIKSNMGEEYLKVRRYHTTSKGAQEAHEAIRPTYIGKHDIDGDAQERKLYALIWRRTVASQMVDAEIEKTTADICISTRQEHFSAVGEVIKKEGFLKVYIEDNDDDAGDAVEDGILPQLSVDEELAPVQVAASERYTLQPSRYTEASLVKKMEELGIGRPSTYAPTISTIQQREYVERGEKSGVRRQLVTLTLDASGKIKRGTRTETYGAEKGKLIPTDIGMVVNDFLTEYFPSILDYNFTAKVEEKFDDIAEGRLAWNEEIRQFYHDFHPDIDRALNMRLEHKAGERELGIDPASGKPVYVKIGRFGPLVQIGSGDGDEKPQFASLQKGQSMNSLTLAEALKLFEYPRNLGDFEGKDVTVAIGRFGPYVRHDGKFVSIPKGMDPGEVSLDQAVELIMDKRQAEERKVVKTFDEDPELRMLNGRYGIYLAWNGSNYKIPKTVTDPAQLSYEECVSIVESQKTAPRKTASRRTARKK